MSEHERQSSSDLSPKLAQSRSDSTASAVSGVHEFDVKDDLHQAMSVDMAGLSHSAAHSTDTAVLDATAAKVAAQYDRKGSMYISPGMSSFRLMNMRNQQGRRDVMQPEVYDWAEPVPEEVDQTDSILPPFDSPPGFAALDLTPVAEEAESAATPKAHQQQRMALPGSIGEAVGISQDEDSGPMPRQQLQVPADAASRQWLATKLAGHYLFQPLAPSVQQDIMAAATLELFAPGTALLDAGNRQDEMFVLVGGRAQVLRQGVDSGHVEGGDVVADAALVAPEVNAHSMAVMDTGHPLDKCSAELRIELQPQLGRDARGLVAWCIRRDMFKNRVIQHAAAQLAERTAWLQRVSLLAGLSEHQLAMLAEELQEVTFMPGEAIIRQGDAGSTFYIVQDGQVVVTKSEQVPEAERLASKNQEVEEAFLLALKAGDFFGEQALLHDAPRAASVWADVCPVVARHAEDGRSPAPGLGQPVQALALHRDAFVLLLGGVMDVMRKTHADRAKAGDKALAEHRTLRRIHTASLLAQSVKQAALSPTAGSHSAVAHSPATSVDSDARTPQLKHLLSSANVLTAGRASQSLLRSAEAVDDRHEAARRGSRHSQSSAGVPDIGRFDLADCKQLAVLGEGAFGLVSLIRHKPTGGLFALKTMQKQRIQDLKQTRNVLSEKRVLTMCKGHPFVLQLAGTSQDANCLYMALEFLQGGDLFGLMTRLGGRTDADGARFYVGGVSLVLEFLHARHIAWRDLKPENIVIDAEGYPRVIDFGFAKEITGRTYTLCGTPEYLSPEQISGRGHGVGVDWWALGVLLYELLAGYSPFAVIDNDHRKVYKNILRGRYRWPSKIRGDEACKHLISSLLSPVNQRTGCLARGAADFKEHAFFSKFDWAALQAKQLPAPHKPELKSDVDLSCFEEAGKSSKKIQVIRFRPDGTNWDDGF